MKSFYAFLIILAAMILIVPTGYCQDKEVRVYFGNGVWNQPRDARRSLAVLQERLENVLTTNDFKVSWDVSYNDADGLYDLFEVAQQLAGDAWTDFWRSLSGLSLLPNFLQEELKKIAERFSEDRIKSYPSIQEHVKKYNKDLCEGKKVVVVAHSQGNLFANIAYKGINKDNIDGFGIVSVATPSWYIAGDPSKIYYTTIEEDKVIGFLPGALRANVNNFPGDNPDDLSGHMFISSYLASGLAAESKILNDVVGKVYTLQWPEGGCNYFVFGLRELWNGSSYTNETLAVWDLDKDKLADDIYTDRFKTDLVTFPCKERDLDYFLSISTGGLGRYTLYGGIPNGSDDPRIVPNNVPWGYNEDNTVNVTAPSCGSKTFVNKASHSYTVTNKPVGKDIQTTRIEIASASVSSEFGWCFGDGLFFAIKKDYNWKETYISLGWTYDILIEAKTTCFLSTFWTELEIAEFNFYQKQKTGEAQIFHSNGFQTNPTNSFFYSWEYPGNSLRQLGISPRGTGGVEKQGAFYFVLTGDYQREKAYVNGGYTDVTGDFLWKLSMGFHYDPDSQYDASSDTDLKNKIKHHSGISNYMDSLISPLKRWEDAFHNRYQILGGGYCFGFVKKNE